MKRMAMVLVVILSVLVSGVALAGNELAQEDIRGNGGYESSVLVLNVNDLNDALTGLGYESLGQVAVLQGGGGMGGSRTGHRLGGFGCGGEMVSKTANGDKAVLGMGFGGFVYERGIYVQGNTDIAVGTMLGGGGATLELTRANHTDEYSKGFIAMEPRVSLHQQIYGRWGVEVRVAYLVTYDFEQNWQIGETNVAGPFHYTGGPRLGVRITYGF